MFKKLATIAALGLVSSAAFAAESPFYAGLDAGKTHLVGHGYRDTSYGVFAGYQIQENIALEVNYRNLFRFNHDIVNHPVDMDVKGYHTGVSVLGSLPLSNGFSLYGRLGYNRLESRASHPTGNLTDSENRAIYGIGVSYAITPSISARIEAQKPISDLNNVSAGVSFKF